MLFLGNHIKKYVHSFRWKSIRREMDNITTAVYKPCCFVMVYPHELSWNLVLTRQIVITQLRYRTALYAQYAASLCYAVKRTLELKNT